MYTFLDICICFFFVKKISCLHTFYEEETNNKCVLCLEKCVQWPWIFSWLFNAKSQQKSWKIFSEKKENTLVKVIVVLLLYFLKKDHGKKDCSMPDIFYSTDYFSATKGKSIIIIHGWKFSAAQRQMNLEFRWKTIPKYTICK